MLPDEVISCIIAPLPYTRPYILSHEHCMNIVSSPHHWQLNRNAYVFEETIQNAFSLPLHPTFSYN
jgi:hypothetical protein